MKIKEIPARRFDIKEGKETAAKEWVVSEEKFQIMINTTEIAFISA